MPRYGVQAEAIGGAGIVAEKKLAGRLGARLTAGSGSGQRSAKGDMHLLNFKLECKSTVNASMSLKLDWLMKISTEAVMAGKEPALAVQFVTGDGQTLPFGSWVMVREDAWKELISCK